MATKRLGSVGSSSIIVHHILPINHPEQPKPVAQRRNVGGGLIPLRLALGTVNGSAGPGSPADDQSSPLLGGIGRKAEPSVRTKAKARPPKTATVAPFLSAASQAVQVDSLGRDRPHSGPSTAGQRAIGLIDFTVGRTRSVEAGFQALSVDHPPEGGRRVVDGPWATADRRGFDLRPSPMLALRAGDESCKLAEAGEFVSLQPNSVDLAICRP